MNNLEILRLSAQLDKFIKREDWAGAFETGEKIWLGLDTFQPVPGEEAETIAHLLAKIADLYQHYQNDLITTVAALKKLYALPMGGKLKGKGPSPWEFAAFHLADIYSDHNCHHSAIFWYQNCLRMIGERNGMQGSGTTEEVNDLSQKKLIPQDSDGLQRILYSLVISCSLAGNTDDARCYSDILTRFLQPIDSLDKAHFLLYPGLVERKYGDREKGEEILRSILAFSSETPEDIMWQVQLRYAFGISLLDERRSTDARRLGEEGLRDMRRFTGSPYEYLKDDLKALMKGLIAKADIQEGKLEEALKTLETLRQIKFTPDDPQEIIYNNPLQVMHQKSLETDLLLGDRARLHLFLGEPEKALGCPVILFYQLGHLIGDQEAAPTSQRRLEWVQKQSEVADEIVSIWLDLPESPLKKAHETVLANILLQLKANLPAAIVGHRRYVYHNFEGVDSWLFSANREYAIAARRLKEEGETLERKLALEDAFFRREIFEEQMVAPVIDFIPSLSGAFTFDFVENSHFDDSAFINYHLMNYCPPENGRKGSSQKLLYIGLILKEGKTAIHLLGEAGEVDRLCLSYLQSITSGSATGLANDLTDRLGQQLYQALVQPFEPLPQNLYLSLDGMLSRVPFHALIQNDAYLVEKYDLHYLHSPLHQYNLVRLSQGLGSIYYANEIALVCGVSNYEGTNLEDLPWAEFEAQFIASLIEPQPEENSGAVVKTFLNEDATPQIFIDHPHPYLIHIAAHGLFQVQDAQLMKPASYANLGWPEPNDYRRNRPLSGLDAPLVNAAVVMGGKPGEPEENLNERLLSALELSSLNLYGCRLVVLSACDTSLGEQSSGAGSLGMQYALASSLCSNALLSLWRIRDKEVSEWMSRFFDQNDARKPHEAYVNTMRALCKVRGKRAHPGNWASFLLMEHA